MSKYKCTNKKCSTYNVEAEERGTHIKYNVDGTQTDIKAICPECKAIRELIEEEKDRDGFCTNIYGGNGNICQK